MIAVDAVIGPFELLDHMSRGLHCVLGNQGMLL